MSVTTRSDHVLLASILIMGLGANPKRKGAVMRTVAGILLAPGREGGEILCIGGFLPAVVGCHSGVQAINMPARAFWPGQYTQPTINRIRSVAPLNHLVTANSGNKGDGYKCATSVATRETPPQRGQTTERGRYQTVIFLKDLHAVICALVGFILDTMIHNAQVGWASNAAN